MFETLNFGQDNSVLVDNVGIPTFVQFKPINSTFLTCLSQLY